MKQPQTNSESTQRSANRARGFSMIEVSVVIALILIISAMAIFALQPSLQDAKYDNAMREVIDQLRQAREYAIANRRYVQVTFPTVVIAGQPTQYQVVTTQKNTGGYGPVGAGADVVLSTVPIQQPAQFFIFPGSVDTPDNFGNGSAIEFEGLNPGPVLGMMFQSDGELVDGGTFQPINGTVFIGFPNQGDGVKSGHSFGRNRPNTRLEAGENSMVSILKEIGKMRETKRRRLAKGFSLLETMVALVVLAVGVLGLAALLYDSLSYMQGSQDDFIAQQKAEEAAEAIFTAKYTANATFAQISNNSGGNPGGLFLTGPQPLLVPGPDGLVGSINDVGAAPAYIVYPGPDGKLGTADDIQSPLTNFTRTIAITNLASEPTNDVRDVIITINYKTGKFTRQYQLETYVSQF